MTERRAGALPLVNLARLRCLQNSHLINDIGCTPYHLIEPILKKKTAKSLHIIEEHSPQILPYSDPLWRSLIQRDFFDRPLEQYQVKNGKRSSVPARDLYEKYAEERELQRKQATMTFKQLTRTLNMRKNKRKVKTLDHVIHSSRGPRGTLQLQHSQQHSSVFKSSLLEKARHQNKIRSQFLSEGKRVSNLSIKTKQPQITTGDKIVRSRASSHVPSLLSYPKMVTKQGFIRTPRVMLSAIRVSSPPVKRRIDISTKGNSKRPKPSPELGRHTSSNVYIYDAK
ncbi:hypothetical protein FOA43_000239 [Brettanomyces nanus]|uniref:Elongin-A n=1 Tax=Eeniella nana TaxID=13502 RepID=A0A875RY28_EENNA|nr:uncharacterized protein FOA43_000239 [Brettanomyces nanus]QPG72935.1 hypothetical protein FOA43_000239 [Brettanomyces nanus]